MRCYVSPGEALIKREFNLVHQEWQFPALFDVAPTQQVPILRGVQGEQRSLPSKNRSARTTCGRVEDQIPLLKLRTS